MEAELGPHMLYTENADKPGYIGALGTALGAAQMNIATFNLGRSDPGGKAIALLGVDEPIPDSRARDNQIPASRDPRSPSLLLGKDARSAQSQVEILGTGARMRKEGSRRIPSALSAPTSIVAMLWTAGISRRCPFSVIVPLTS